jgi:hypothetical protein
MNNLGRLLRNEGDFVAAWPLLERAIAIAEKALGPENEQTLICMRDFAGLLHAQGDLTEARSHRERILIPQRKGAWPPSLVHG